MYLTPDPDPHKVNAVPNAALHLKEQFITKGSFSQMLLGRIGELECHLDKTNAQKDGKRV
jgi:hypothetical protein